MRGQRRRAGNPGVEEAPQHYLTQWQEHDAERRDGRDGVFAYSARTLIWEASLYGTRRARELPGRRRRAGIIPPR